MRVSLETSRALRVVCALLVFFCHCSPYFNLVGFIPVGVFFFISGYGISMSSGNPLNRIPRLCVMYAFAAFCYSLVFGSLYTRIPVYWFFVIYFVQLLLYRISPRAFFVLAVDFVIAVFMWLSGEFNFPWWASMVCFPLGMWLHSHELRLSGWIHALVLVLGLVGLVYSRGFPLFIWMVSVPCCIAMVSFGRRVEGLHPLHYLTPSFFLFHCLALDVVGVRADLGISPVFGQTVSIMLSFILAVAMSYAVYKFWSKVFE